VRTWTRRSAQAGVSSLRGAALRLGDRRPRIRVGWVAADTLHGGARRLSRLHPPVSMRITNTAFWINAHSGRIRNELYRPGRLYDVVVFFKTMDRGAQEEAARIKERGGKVVFDANVNYYEVWGDYEVDGTQPTPEQQQDARAMTELADHVVADSSYLLEVVAPLSEHASWIPDNVDTALYRGRRTHRPTMRLRLVWSGVAKKADHLLDVADALASVAGLELVLVSDRQPAAMGPLSEALPCRYIRFSDPRYAATLRRCDVIVSPKRLANAYEVAHTEYKITLGMAVGLPALASPQQSYVEAIEHGGGGIVAGAPAEWRTAFERLRDDAPYRAELGARARRTVHDRYATPVVARRYLELIESLA
jgi:glycosyltransferase involved in cell wall biosynthesis